MTSSLCSETEINFFNDVKSLLLEKYPDLKDKFGIWKAHQHFELNEDEVFHETSNEKTKESTLRIIKKSELPKQAFASTWYITENGPIVATWCCDDSPNHDTLAH